MKKAKATAQDLNELYEGILQLQSVGECKKFFRDLCTVAELAAMAERFQAAKLIYENVPYREVNRQTGVSTTTVTRVAHWLYHGKGGYKLVLGRLKS